MSKQLTKRQARRLLNVSRALREALTPQTFDMGAYVHDEFSASEALGFDLYSTSEQEDKQISEFCGTPACALGHYGSRRDLQKLVRIGVDRMREPGLFYKNNKGVDFTDPKILEHFGIYEDQAHLLFGGFGCGNARTPDAAAAYIERFVDRHYGPV